MFKRIFKKRNPDKLSKVDYWNKWELFELFKDLYRAEKILTDNENYKKEDNFLKFKNNFIEELHEIEGDKLLLYHLPIQLPKQLGLYHN